MRLVEFTTQTIQWVTRPADQRNIDAGEAVVVWVDVAKVEAGWSKDANMYVGPGGTHNAIKTRYPDFGTWLKGGKPVEMSDMGLDWRGRPAFGNGRHRFAWMRDHGAKAVPVVTPTEGLEEFVRLYGTGQRQTVLTTV